MTSRCTITNIPDESESSAFPGIPISWYVNIADFTASLKYTTQIFGRCAIREIIHLQRHHAVNTRRRSTVTHFEEYFSLCSNKTLFFELFTIKWRQTQNRKATTSQRALQGNMTIWRPEKEVTLDACFLCYHTNNLKTTITYYKCRANYY